MCSVSCNYLINASANKVPEQDNINRFDYRLRKAFYLRRHIETGCKGQRIVFCRHSQFECQLVTDEAQVLRGFPQCLRPNIEVT